GRVAPVAADGTVDIDALAPLLDPGVTVVSVMLANNEVGTIQPLAEVAAVVRQRAPHAVLHTDAVQAFPWLDVTVAAAPDDLVAVPGAAETGDRARKVAGNCHISFDGVESEALLMLLDGAGVCASAGSACASGATEPSHVLVAMGVPASRALGSLRLSLGP